MSGAAIAMMIVAILIIWGGLGFALLNLYKHPETDTGDSDEAPAHSDADGASAAS